MIAEISRRLETEYKQQRRLRQQELQSQVDEKIALFRDFLFKLLDAGDVHSDIRWKDLCSTPAVRNHYLYEELSKLLGDDGSNGGSKVREGRDDLKGDLRLGMYKKYIVCLDIFV